MCDKSIIINYFIIIMLYIGYDPEVGGIGDFVYILFQFYYFYVSCGGCAAAIQICIPDHPLKHCIECIADAEPSLEKVRAIACATLSNTFVRRIYSDVLKTRLIYSNMNDFLHLYVRHAPPSKINVLRREFREQVFRVSPRISEYVETLIASSPAFYCGGKYAAIHIRCGDKYLRGGGGGEDDERCSPETSALEEKFERGVNFLRRRAAHRNIPIFIFCDNTEVKRNLAAVYKCHLFDTNIIHISDASVAADATIETFAEFVLLSRAIEIFAVSISNFSQVPAFIYDIPIYTMVSDKIVKCITI